MASIDETKAQLMRGVVQDNVDVLRGVRTRPLYRRQRRLQLWFWGGSLAIVIALSTLSSYLISRGSAPARSGAAVSPVAAVLNIDFTPESEVPLSHPRPINREAIPLAIKTIVIDPGHGGEPGAISESGVTEKEITLDVALRLRRLLENGPFEVLLTRETDRRLSLDQRVAFANEHKADLFLSIHVNWMEPHTIRPLETYYVGPTDDPATLKLASRENKDSAYALSDYKQILEKIYVDARRDESRAFAKTIQTRLFRSLKPKNPLLQNRGVKTAPFVVLIGTQMPAVLVEISSLSNEEDVELLTKMDYRENIALALLEGIRGYANGFNAFDGKGR
jgi:N-acetylmuramoyl-L-alanine amidase